MLENSSYVDFPTRDDVGKRGLSNSIRELLRKWAAYEYTKNVKGLVHICDQSKELFETFDFQEMESFHYLLHPGELSLYRADWEPFLVAIDKANKFIDKNLKENANDEQHHSLALLFDACAFSTFRGVYVGLQVM